MKCLFIYSIITTRKPLREKFKNKLGIIYTMGWIFLSYFMLMYYSMRKLYAYLNVFKDLYSHHADQISASKRNVSILKKEYKEVGNQLKVRTIFSISYFLEVACGRQIEYWANSSANFLHLLHFKQFLEVLSSKLYDISFARNIQTKISVIRQTSADYAPKLIRIVNDVFKN